MRRGFFVLLALLACLLAGAGIAAAGALPPPIQADALLVSSRGSVYIQRGGKWGLATPEGAVLAEPAWDAVVVGADADFAVIGGEMFLLSGLGEVQGEALDVLAEEEAGVAAGESNAPLRARRAGQWGLLDRAGRWVSPPAWDEIGGFREGLCAVRKGERWGFLNERGMVGVAVAWDAVGDFHAGLCPVRKGDLWGYIDAQGNLALEPAWQEAYPFIGEGDAAWARVRGEAGFGFIDTTGKAVVRPEWAYAWSPNGRHVLVKSGKELWGILDRQGEWVYPLRFTDIVVWNDATDKIAAYVVRQSGKIGFLTDQFQWAQKPKYTFRQGYEGELLPSFDGAFECLLDGKIEVLVDPKGEDVVRLRRFDKATAFGEGVAGADGRIYVVLVGPYGEALGDAEGNYLTEPEEYERVALLIPTLFEARRQDGSGALIGEEGRIVQELGGGAGVVVQPPLVFAQQQAGDVWAVYDARGNQLVALVCQTRPELVRFADDAESALLAAKAEDAWRVWEIDLGAMQ